MACEVWNIYYLANFTGKGCWLSSYIIDIGGKDHAIQANIGKLSDNVKILFEFYHPLESPELLYKTISSCKLVVNEF